MFYLVITRNFQEKTLEMFLFYILMTPSSVVEYVNPKSPPIIIHGTSVNISAAFIMQKNDIL